MKNKVIIRVFGIAAGVGLLSSCNAGDMRMWDDAMASANGQSVSYADQQYVEYVGDIKVTIGSEYGSGFYRLHNTGTDYCRVKLTFENEGITYRKLNPGGKARGNMSIYNQLDGTRTRCNATRAVFNEPFD